MTVSVDSDDTYNLVELHVLRALWEDVKLAGLVTLNAQTASQWNPTPEVALNAAALTGASSLVLKNSSGGELEGWVHAAQTFTIAGDATTYTVSAEAQASSDLVTVSFSPTLAADAAEDAVVTLSTPSLLVKTWRLEHPQDVSDYARHQLPAVSAQVTLQGQEVVSIGGQVADGFVVSLLLVDSVGRVERLLAAIKQRAARIERVMQQQHLVTKQLAGLDSTLAGATGNTVQCVIQGTALGVVPVEDSSTVVRGAAEILVGVAIDLTLPED